MKNYFQFLNQREHVLIVQWEENKKSFMLRLLRTLFDYAFLAHMSLPFRFLKKYLGKIWN